MSQEIKGMVYDIQGFSVQDGPGIRTTAFLKGCPLRCPWCHSPESQGFKPQLSWISMRCLGTDACKSRCIKACPENAIEIQNGKKSNLGKRTRYYQSMISVLQYLENRNKGESRV